MRQGSIRLGRIMGVPLAMDLGVLLIGGLLTWTLATIVLPSSSPGLQPAAYWSVGAIIRWQSKTAFVRFRTALMMPGPKVMFGTKCPSITSR